MIAQTPAVLADLFYLKKSPKWDTEKPFTFFLDVSGIPGAANTNIEKQEVKNVPIFDVRGRSSPLSVDVEGFEVVNLGDHFEAAAFEDEQWIETVYYDFICDLLKKKLSAEEVSIYDHQLRYRHPGFGKTEQLRGAMCYDPPIPQVHADFSPLFSTSLLEDCWANHDESKNRYQVFKWATRLLAFVRTDNGSIWRPLVDTVEEWPLAVCDHTSMNVSRDLRLADQVKKSKPRLAIKSPLVFGESYLAHHHTEHMWYYLSNQRYSEGLMLKLYDSQVDVATSTLHTAIDIGEGRVARRSIEIRVLVKR